MDGLIVPCREYFPAAVQNGAGVIAALDLPQSNPATEVLISGANQDYPALQFADGAVNYARKWIRLPADLYLPGGLALQLLWATPASSGDVQWFAETAFVEEGASLDPTFNAPSEVTDAAEAVAGAFAKSSINLDVTGAVAGAMLCLQISRDATDSDDDLADDVNLIGVEFQYQRLMVLP